MRIESFIIQDVLDEDVGTTLAKAHPHSQAYVLAAYFRGLAEVNFEESLIQLDRSLGVCLDEGEFELAKRFFEVMNEEINAPRGEV